MASEVVPQPLLLQGFPGTRLCCHGASALVPAIPFSHSNSEIQPSPHHPPLTHRSLKDGYIKVRGCPVYPDWYSLLEGLELLERACVLSPRRGR